MSISHKGEDIVKAYYGELCAEDYEIDKSIADGKELEFYLSFVTDQDMKVLEPMCGNGRMLLPFLERGIDVEGFDISEDMLTLCRAKGRALHLEPTVFNCRLEEFKSSKKYDLVIIPFGSFSLVTDEVAKRSLSNLLNVLNEGGKILLTVMIGQGPFEYLPEWTEADRFNIRGKEVIKSRKMYFDEESKILHSALKYQLTSNGIVEKEEIMDFPIRYYEEGEFESFLKNNGVYDFVRHEVEDGYGLGSSFQVFECRN